MITSDASLYDGCSVGDLAVLAFSRYADRVALVTGDQEYTYRDVKERVSQVIQVLKAHGLKQGDGLAMLSINRPEVLFVSLAVNIMGVRYTPLHPLGSEDDHKYILEDAEITALIVDNQAYAERGRALQDNVPALKKVFTFGEAAFGIDLSAAMTNYTPQPLVVESCATDICNIQYTGGTTGRPKGVIHPHRSLVAARMATLVEVDWPKNIRFLAVTPLSHAAGAMILPVLLQGGTIYPEPKFDPAGFLKKVEQERINIVFIVPTIIYVLLDQPDIQKFDLSSLHTILYGASPIAPSRLAEALKMFGPVFQQGYGQTEAPLLLCVLHKQDHDPARPDRLASCGTPTAGMIVKILDEDHQEVPVGDVGEICVRGPQVMEGYWKRPEETVEAFRGDWLHTGDMARRDEDGYITIVDRAKDMIITGGFNVFPREIEDVLAQHPAVAMSAVIGVPDERWGEQVKAVVVLKAEAEATAEDLMAFVQDRKGKVYAPKSVDFADSIPVTALGKPDKKQIRAQYWQGEARQVH